MGVKGSGIGGQAVMEGVMMKNGDRYAVAVRKPDKEIIVKTAESPGFVKGKKFLGLPFVRGVFNFVDSLVLGMKTKNRKRNHHSWKRRSMISLERKKEWIC